MKFGYSPDNGIKFDSAAQTLSFYQGGIQRIDISSFGLAVRNGEGLVVGHTAQVVAGFGDTPEVQTLGTGGSDTENMLGRWSNNGGGPSIHFVKSRNATIGSNTVVVSGDTLGQLLFLGDDGTDFQSIGASISAQVDGTPGTGDMPGRLVFSTTADGAQTVTEALRIDSSQNVQMRSESYLWIGPDSAATGFVDAAVTVGAVINQETNFDTALALKFIGGDSGFAHPMTGIVEADTYGQLGPGELNEGGLRIAGFTDALAHSAIYMQGRAGVTVDTTKSTAGKGVFRLDARVTDGGTSVGAVGADGNLLNIDNSGVTRFIFDAEGSGHADVEWTTYDAYDDIALIGDIESELLGIELPGQTERRHVMERAGIISVEGWHIENGKQRAMVNFTKLAMLHHGGLIQMGQAHMSLVERVDSLAIELTEAKQQLAALTA